MGLAKLLGVHHMTVWRREKGDLPITREAELALLAVTAEMERERTVEILRDALDVIARNVATERSGSREEPYRLFDIERDAISALKAAGLV